MQSITLSCRYGYLKLVDLGGKPGPRRLREIGQREGLKRATQYCIGLKGNQQFEAAVLICGTTHTTSLHDRSSLTIFDRLFVGCGDRVFCLNMPQLISVWAYGFEDRSFVGLGTMGDDLLLMFQGNLSRLTLNGSLVWNVPIPHRISTFPIVDDMTLSWPVNISSLILDCQNGSVVT